MTPPTRTPKEIATSSPNAAEPIVIDAEEFEQAKADPRHREAAKAAEAYLAQLRDEGRDG
jgi:hypothetical protein